MCLVWVLNLLGTAGAEGRHRCCSTFGLILVYICLHHDLGSSVVCGKPKRGVTVCVCEGWVVVATRVLCACVVPFLLEPKMLIQG